MGAHVFMSMGTAVSLHTPGAPPSPSVLASVADAFRERDERFSLFRSDSEAALLARGERTLMASSESMRDAYAEAMAWSSRTGGVFTPHRPDGAIDLSGSVKADAIAAAGRVLDAAGVDEWMLNAGGDILWSGAAGSRPWHVGVVDPTDRRRILCSLDAPPGRRALATSGTAERGEHVWRARTPAARAFRQVSVLADDIVTADVLATTVLAGGGDVLDDVLDGFGVDVLCVDDGGNVSASGAFQSARGIHLL